jgi:hypothetical protein
MLTNALRVLNKKLIIKCIKIFIKEYLKIVLTSVFRALINKLKRFEIHIFCFLFYFLDKNKAIFFFF